MASTYKRVTITPPLLREAVERARVQPVYENSHRKGDANIVGCIGEVVFEKLLSHFGIEFEDCRDGTEHDYRIGDITVDVKTKDRTVPPRSWFENSVPLYNHEHQRPHFYYFVSLLRDQGIGHANPGRYTRAYLLGGIDLETLDREGTTWETGQTDPSNGTTFWTACINVSMAQLISNREVLRCLRGGTAGR